jgi:hypothetical protein
MRNKLNPKFLYDLLLELMLKMFLELSYSRFGIWIVSEFPFYNVDLKPPNLQKQGSKFAQYFMGWYRNKLDCLSL